MTWKKYTVNKNTWYVREDDYMLEMYYIHRTWMASKGTTTTELAFPITLPHTDYGVLFSKVASANYSSNFFNDLEFILSKAETKKATIKCWNAASTDAYVDLQMHFICPK